MHLNFVFIAVALAAFTGRNHVAASFWDSIPVVSQIKSVVQDICGDPEGAEQTQKNFLNQAPLVSQGKSLYHLATGDNEEALRTQEKFLHEFIEPVADNTPVVGHIKGTIHIAAGDTERGKHIFKGATTSTAAVVGGMVAGPAGAITAGVVSDGIFTGIDSAVDQEYKPFGIIEYASNIDKQSPGEHFDAAVGLGAQFAVAKATKGSGKVKPTTRKDPHPYNPLEEETFAGAPKRKHSRDNILRKSSIEPSMAVQRRRLSSDIPEFQMDLNDPVHLDLARKKSGLVEEYAQKLEAIDFCRVNDVLNNNMHNCYYCCLAALKGITVTELFEKTGLIPREGTAPTIEYILNLYRRHGFPEAQIIFHGGTPEQFYGFLLNNIMNGETIHFSLAYGSYDETGHMVLARAWKTSEGNVKLLTTDFQKEPFTYERFAIGLPRNVKTVYVIVHS